MKLLSIHLHPFGGTANRTSTLHDGINVLEGPNEFGKSTLSNALWHSLFTATNLTPANLQKTMGRWYPKPGGDHARVTLQFHADGQIWTLQKTWGVGAASSLQADGAASIADPGKVQTQLLSLLRRNEATWRHVLFTSQAQLTATIEQLRANAEKVDEVQNFLAGATAIPGDIPPEKLTAAIDAKYAQHFGRWDIQANGPEKGRGVDNKWANGVGPLLDSWYAMTEISRDLDQVIRHEQAVDEINSKILRLTGDMSQDDEFVRIGRTLRDGLGRRSGLEEICKRLTTEVQSLKVIMRAWPGADQVIQGKETELTGVIKDIESLEAELKNARKRIQAEQLRASHQILTKAKRDWKIAADQLAASKTVPAELLAELKKLEKEIDHLRIQIAAQKLTAKLESPNSVSINIQRGADRRQATWQSRPQGIVQEGLSGHGL
jgi:DNA repair exonuclease SbcCD ATPase subunit